MRLSGDVQVREFPLREQQLTLKQSGINSHPNYAVLWYNLWTRPHGLYPFLPSMFASNRALSSSADLSDNNTPFCVVTGGEKIMLYLRLAICYLDQKNTDKAVPYLVRVVIVLRIFRVVIRALLVRAVVSSILVPILISFVLPSFISSPESSAYSSNIFFIISRFFSVSSMTQLMSSAKH